MTTDPLILDAVSVDKDSQLSSGDDSVAPFGAIRDLGERIGYQKLVSADASVSIAEVAVPMVGGLPPFPSPFSTPNALWRAHPVYRMSFDDMVITPTEAELGEANKRATTGAGSSVASLVSEPYALRIALMIDSLGGLDHTLAWTKRPLSETPALGSRTIEAISLALYNSYNHTNAAITRAGLVEAVLAGAREHGLVPSDRGESVSARSWLRTHRSLPAHPDLADITKCDRYHTVSSRFGEFNSALHQLGDFRQPDKAGFLTELMADMAMIRTHCTVLALAATGVRRSPARYSETLTRASLGISRGDARDVSSLEDVVEALKTATPKDAESAFIDMHNRMVNAWNHMRWAMVEMDSGELFSSPREMDRILSEEYSASRWDGLTASDTPRHRRDESDEILADLGFVRSTPVEGSVEEEDVSFPVFDREDDSHSSPSSNDKLWEDIFNDLQS